MYGSHLKYIRYDEIRKTIGVSQLVVLIQFMTFRPKEDFHFLIQLKPQVSAAEGIPLNDQIMRLLFDQTRGQGLAMTEPMEVLDENGNPFEKGDPKQNRSIMNSLHSNNNRMIDHRKVSGTDAGSTSLHAVPTDKQLKIQGVHEASQQSRTQKTLARRQAAMTKTSDGIEITPISSMSMTSWTDDDGVEHLDALQAHSI